MNTETLFWVLHLPLMVVFVVGMVDVFGIWFKGRWEGGGQKNRSAVGKAFAFLKLTLSVLFSRRLFVLLRSFITEAWFNRRLWRTNRLRWLSHFMLLSGFMLTMTLSGIAAVSDKVLHYIFDLGHVPWIAMWYNPDHPVTAVLNEIGGVLMTVGLLFFVVRRYVFRPEQVRTGTMDTWMVVGMGLILLSGWVAEILRLNSHHAEGMLALSFVGYPLSRLVSGLQLDWDFWFEQLYVIHGILTSLVIVTIPYSKFMHVIAGGLTAVIDQFQQDTAGLGGEGGGVHVHA